MTSDIPEGEEIQSFWKPWKTIQAENQGENFGNGAKSSESSGISGSLGIWENKRCPKTVRLRASSLCQ